MLRSNKIISLKLSEPRLKKRNQALSFLMEMSNFLVIPMKIEDLLKGALSKVLDHFCLRFGRIYLMEEGGASLYLAAHQGIEIEGLLNVSINEGFTGKAARTRSFIAQHVSEFEDKKRASFLQSKGLKISICVPLISGNQVRGVMNLASSEVIDLDPEKIDLFTAVGNQIAVAVNNARLYSELENSLKVLEEKQETIKFFTYSMAHDLKSPAIGVYGLTRLLKEKYGNLLDDRGQTYCRQILKTAEQMVALLENLNVFISTKEVPMNFEKVEIQKLMDEIRDSFSTLLEERGILWLQPKTLPEIVADPLALSRVFKNLVENTLKYGGDNVRNIQVGYEKQSDFHVFSFKDDGRGIEQKNREKIFDRFQRNGTSRGVPGSGLGLAIVKEVAEKHGGKVWLDSESGNGAKFYITISKNLSAAESN